MAMAAMAASAIRTREPEKGAGTDAFGSCPLSSTRPSITLVPRGQGDVGRQRRWEQANPPAPPEPVVITAGNKFL